MLRLEVVDGRYGRRLLLLLLLLVEMVVATAGAVDCVATIVATD